MSPSTTVQDLLLTRRGLVFLSSVGATPIREDHLQAVESELAELGHAVSARLRARLAECTIDELVAFRAWAVAKLAAYLGADQTHEPLFRRFPEGVPADTLELWWSKVLVHFLQAEGQSCLFCRRTGTTHVLDPCCHVVCDHCFDGSSYSACPVCEHKVERGSPFFLAPPARGAPKERVVFRLLDLGESVEEEAWFLFASLCERKQALSPLDREALAVTVREHRARVLSWLPSAIPVRENVALVFGTLLSVCDPADVLPHATRYIQSATDVLRIIAVLSGTDGSLLPETIVRAFEAPDVEGRFWGRIAKLLGAEPPTPGSRTIAVPLSVRRFKVARLSRPLRRTILALLEGMPRDRLVEDMLRHRAYWVWIGEFLHPAEHCAKFPNAAFAFAVARKKAPDGSPAPPFRGWYSRLEETVRARDAGAMLAVLGERPGELARRFDHALRVAGDDTQANARIVERFRAEVRAFATPVLLTLRSHLRARDRRAEVRVYWPKGRVAMGVSSPDRRALLGREAIEPSLRAIDAELLRRFGERPAFGAAIVDEGLSAVTVPFNERTASSEAVSLPRGSRVRVPKGKIARLFLHWCQPEDFGIDTDLDLSVAFYDEAWRYAGVCSYYQLQHTGPDGAIIARSAGDLQNAPWPDGATEFVDLHVGEALSAGIRYAVMVVNDYAGMPFSSLERGYAGLMLRDDPGGQHFDPRTVELKFALAGERGVYLPLVFDLREGTIHWLDVYAKGQLHMNNVETSKGAIARICPELMGYFESGVRPSMYELALLHAAARCERVFIRGSSIAELTRRPGETREAFHERLVKGDADEPRSRPPPADGPPILAALVRGDLDLPEGSAAYALFRERVVPSLAASDLLS